MKIFRKYRTKFFFELLVQKINVSLVFIVVNLKNLELISNDEFYSIPETTRGRISLQQVNEVISKVCEAKNFCRTQLLFFIIIK